MKHAVVFDMDGLMFDTERLYCQAWDYAGEKSGLGKTGYMVMKTLGTNRETGRSIWRREFGSRYNQEEIEGYTQEFFDQYYQSHPLPVKKGLRNLLHYLKANGYPTAVASSTPRDQILEHLKEAELTGFFDQIVGGDSVTRSKPDPEIYLYACEMLEMKPTDCYALEDSRNGLLAASSAGCQTIMVPDLWQPDEEIKSRVLAILPDLDAVLEYLKQHSNNNK